MAQTIAFYEERAAEAAQEADKATLQNVRERALRSEAAWRDMAERAILVEKGREDKRKLREDEAAQTAEPVAEA